MGYQGLSWIAGFIAKKYKKLRPDLGTKTALVPEAEGHGTTPWIFHTSKGGLMKPSEAFMEDVEIFNSEFINFHGTDVNREPGIYDRLAAVLQSRFGDKYPKEIYKQFAKSRYVAHVQLELFEKNDSSLFTFLRKIQFYLHFYKIICWFAIWIHLCKMDMGHVPNPGPIFA